MGDVWVPHARGAPPAGRYYHTAVWTGSEMIVWGGFNGSDLGDGSRYNPAASTWTAVTTNGAPGGRSHDTAVWTGTEILVEKLVARPKGYFGPNQPGTSH